MWITRALLAATLFISVGECRADQPTSAWIAYYVRFQHDDHTNMVQSRSLWKEGADVVTYGGRWKFIFRPQFASEESEKSKLVFEVFPERTSDSDLALPLYRAELDFVVRELIEHKFKDDDRDVEMTFIVSPE